MSNLKATRVCITVENSPNPSTGVYENYTITLSQRKLVLSLLENVHITTLPFWAQLFKGWIELPS